MRSAVAIAIGVVISVAALTAGAEAASDDLELASRAAGASGAKGNAQSAVGTLSADGRRTAFWSQATNLHPADTDTADDVFVRDLQADTLVLVTRAAGAGGAKGNRPSVHADISGNGRFVAFASSATNLHPDDTDTADDVFVRDLQDETLVLVSRAAGASGAKANGASGVPSISADGRHVAFVSLATNLHPDGADAHADVFVRDLWTGEVALVSRAAGTHGEDANGVSLSPDVSGDGGLVAFESSATNLHPADTDTSTDVFVRDLQAGATTLASRADGAEGAAADGASSSPAISGDGRSVAFSSTATNLHPDDADAADDVFVRDLRAGVTVLASRAAGATGPAANGSTGSAAVSHDGRLVAFESSATNLHPADTDTADDVFVRDLQDGTVVLVSRAAGADGATGNGASVLPSLSPDGRFVAFASSSTNLHPDDHDAIVDVLVREQPLPRGVDVAQEPAPEPAPIPTTTVTPPPAAGACADGIDDDRDGFADGADPQCRAGRGREDPVDNPLLACAGAEIVLTDVLPAGRRVRLAGYADRALAGREVVLHVGTRAVARTRVAADGSFAVGVRRQPGRYSARIGAIRSRGLRLERRAIGASASHAAGSVTFGARVIAGGRRGGRIELLLRRPGACGAYTVAATRRLPRSGRFRIRTAAPPGAAVAVYRARIRLRGRTTYTLPRVVFLR